MDVIRKPGPGRDDLLERLVAVEDAVRESNVAIGEVLGILRELVRRRSRAAQSSTGRVRRWRARRKAAAAPEPAEQPAEDLPGVDYWGVRPGRTCRFPLGDIIPLSSARFCGAPTPQGAVYCAAHRKIAVRENA
jgi:hypothetical protein